MTTPMLLLQPGWIGCFTREQAHGVDVLPNGTRVVKASAETGVPVGTQGVVLGSMWFDSRRGEASLEGGDTLVYFVEWSIAPRTATCIHAFRVKADTCVR